MAARTKGRTTAAPTTTAPARVGKLALESLEKRELLAADLAEVSGVVRADMQGDADASNDTVVVGATATLYRDGGNGSFDGGSGDDTIVGASVTTDANGRYRFDGVAEGNYFVKIDLPSDLQFRAGEGVQAVTITGDEGDGIIGPTIDGFTTFQTVDAVPPPVSSDANSLVDAAVLGGERDLWVQLTESTNPISSVSLAASGGNLYVASGPGATGNVKIVWDGTDGDARNVNATGLGGVDLTESNGNTMTGIALTSGADHPNAKIMLRIYSDANNWSEFTTVVPESPGGAAAGQAIFNFDDVPTGQSGSGADFTNVGALELTFEGVTAVDAQVSLIGLVGRANKVANFTASPRLSLGDKVWADIDDDGLLEAGEQTIAGVKLNLYEDTNLDNQYTSGTDKLLDTQDTGAGGMYLFTDLFPGKYIVQVDASNFQPNGPLAGLRSSLGDAAATDPDDRREQRRQRHSPGRRRRGEPGDLPRGSRRTDQRRRRGPQLESHGRLRLLRFRPGTRQGRRANHDCSQRDARLHDQDRQPWPVRSGKHDVHRRAPRLRDLRLRQHEHRRRGCAAQQRHGHRRFGHPRAGGDRVCEHRRDGRPRRHRHVGQHGLGQCPQGNQPLEQHRLG